MRGKKFKHIEIPCQPRNNKKHKEIAGFRKTASIEKPMEYFGKLMEKTKHFIP
jgi:hypothetical protein